MGEGLRLDAVRANEHLLLETARQWRYLPDASQPAMRPTRSFFLGAMQPRAQAPAEWRSAM
jgi:hypothetical protein